MSSLSTSEIASCLLALNAGTPFSDEQRTRLESFVQTPVPKTETETETTPETTTATTVLVEKAKKPRKATTVKDAAKAAEEAALLAPAESAAPAALSAEAPTAKAGADGVLANTFEDPLRHHKHRLATYDTSLCVGRKIDEKNPLVGTRPGDEGSKGKFYPEKQCSKKPLAGGVLCKICSEKDKASKANQEVKAWSGRLDEPLHPYAYVVGSECFYTKYPQGLLNDPTTRPPTAAVAAAAATTNSESKATKGKAPAKTAGRPKKEAKVSATTAAATVSADAEAEKAEKAEADAGPAGESVALEIAPEIIRHVIFLHKGKSYVRDTKNGNVYTHKVMTKPAETVCSENYAGRWMDGVIKPYEDEAEAE